MTAPDGAIRAFVVDDSAVVRRIVSSVLSDAGINVVKTAPSGDAALGMIEELDVDVMTLDIEMPGRNGIETLIELRKTHPKLPVVMLSTLTERGAIATLDALAAGASDYVTKPSNAGSTGEALDQLRDSLIPKIQALCLRRNTPRVRFAERPTQAPAAVTPTKIASARAPIDVVAIGVSTGGPNALAEVLGNIRSLAVPVVIVQHMPPVFTRLLAERLDKVSGLRVKEAEEGDRLEAGTALLAPGDFHMELSGTKVSPTVSLNQREPENWCRPAVDVLFRSVATMFGAHSLGVILTGMGQDGTAGSKKIHEAGGTILAQDEASSVVWGMPGFVAKAGIASALLPLEEVAGSIQTMLLTRVGGPRPR